MRHVILLIPIVLYSLSCVAQHEPERGMGIIETVIDTRAYPCFDVYEGRPANTTHVIDSESAYRKYRESHSDQCDFPGIDFKRYSLLGMYGGGNNYCSAEHFRHVADEPGRAKYIFTLTVVEKGFCKRVVRWHWHWVLVPRMPETYEVEFNVNRVRAEKGTSEMKRGSASPKIERSYPCKSIGDSHAAPGQGGIYGKTVAGPNSPVNRKGETTDSYMPLQAAGVIRSATNNKEIKRFTSDVNGVFRVRLPPGKYIVEGLQLNGKPWPRPHAPCVVTVDRNRLVEITIRYDTGIR